MTSTGFGWRAGAFTLLLVLLLAIAVGSATAQLDDQYAYASVPERVVVGVVGGAFLAATLSPVAALLAAMVGVWAGLYHRSRTVCFGSRNRR